MTAIKLRELTDAKLDDCMLFEGVLYQRLSNEAMEFMLADQRALAVQQSEDPSTARAHRWLFYTEGNDYDYVAAGGMFTAEAAAELEGKLEQAWFQVEIGQQVTVKTMFRDMQATVVEIVGTQARVELIGPIEADENRFLEEDIADLQPKKS